MGYTEEQKGLVKDAWQKIQPNLENLGIVYFRKIFEHNPSLMERFQCIKDFAPTMDCPSPVDHPTIKCHAAEVFKLICECGVKLCDDDKAKLDPSTLRGIGNAHNENNVQEIDFPVYATSMDETLKEYFTNDFGEALKEAHQKLIEQMKDAQAHSELIQEMRDAISELRAASVIAV